MPLRLTFSLAALVLVNLVPLAGALFLGWSVTDILLLFWLENVVIGFVNVLRMGVRTIAFREWSGLFLMPFFAVHFGAFCAAHGAFLMGFAVWTQASAVPEFAIGASGVIAIIRELAGQPAMFWALIGMAVSHGASFIVNFLLGGEVRRADLRTLMGQPYARIMILHVTIIFGAVAVFQIGQPVWALALLVLLKIGVDVAAHLAERKKLGSPPMAPAAS